MGIINLPNCAVTIPILQARHLQKKEIIYKSKMYAQSSRKNRQDQAFVLFYLIASSAQAIALRWLSATNCISFSSEGG